MKKKLLIVAYLFSVGSILLFLFVFLGRFLIYWINNLAFPLEETLLLSLKIGLFGGSLGGISSLIIRRR